MWRYRFFVRHERRPAAPPREMATRCWNRGCGVAGGGYGGVVQLDKVDDGIVELHGGQRDLCGGGGRHRCRHLDLGAAAIMGRFGYFRCVVRWRWRESRQCRIPFPPSLRLSSSAWSSAAAAAGSLRHLDTEENGQVTGEAREGVSMVILSEITFLLSTRFRFCCGTLSFLASGGHRLLRSLSLGWPPTDFWREGAHGACCPYRQRRRRCCSSQLKSPSSPLPSSLHCRGLFLDY